MGDRRGGHRDSRQPTRATPRRSVFGRWSPIGHWGFCGLTTVAARGPVLDGQASNSRMIREGQPDRHCLAGPVLPRSAIVGRPSQLDAVAARVVKLWEAAGVIRRV